MKKYKLYDAYYDELKLLVECDTMEDVRKACHKRDLGTGYEWFPLLYKLEGRFYKIVESWSYYGI